MLAVWVDRLLKPVHNWSLSTRLNLLFLTILIVPLLLVVGWSDYQARATISTQQEKSLTRISQDLAEKLDARLNQSLDEVLNLGRNTNTRSFVELKQAPQPDSQQLDRAEANIRSSVDDIMGRQ